MATNRTRINQPEVRQYFSRDDARTPEDALNMDILLIAPVTKNYPLYTEDGSFNPEAQVLDRTLSLMPYRGPTGTAAGGVEGIAFPLNPTNIEDTIEDSVRVYSVNTAGVPKILRNEADRSFCCELNVSDLDVGGNVGLSFVDISGISDSDKKKIKSAQEKGYIFYLEGIPCVFEDVADPGFSFANSLVAQKWSTFGPTVTIEKGREQWRVQESNRALVYAGKLLDPVYLQMPSGMGRINLDELRNSFTDGHTLLDLGTGATIDFAFNQTFGVEVDYGSNKILVNFEGSDLDDDIEDWLKFVWEVYSTNPQALGREARSFFKSTPIRSLQDLLDLTQPGGFLDGADASEFGIVQAGSPVAAPATLTFGSAEPAFLIDLGDNFPLANSITIEESTGITQDSPWEEVVEYDPEWRSITLNLSDTDAVFPTCLAENGVEVFGTLTLGSSYIPIDIPAGSLGFGEDLEDVFAGLSNFPVYRAGACEIFRLRKGDIVVPVLFQKDSTDLSAMTSPNWAAELYIERTSLRKQFTLDASLLTTGNRPSTTLVTKNTYKDVLGKPELSNPAAMAAKVFFDSAPTYRCFVMSPNEVTGEEPYGTASSILDVAKFVQGRDAYHLVALNNSDSFAYQAREYLESLGGTETRHLVAEQRLYIHRPTPTQKTPHYVASTTISQATVTAGEWGADIVVQDPKTIEALSILWGIQPDTAFNEADLEDVYVQFRNMPLVGEVTLVDGTKATRLQPSSVNFSEGVLEFSLLGESNLPTLLEPTPINILSIEKPFTGSKIERIEQTVQEIVNRGNDCTHPRLNRVLGDSITTIQNGASIRLGGEFAVASLAGIIAANPQWKPVTGKRFEGFTEVTGTSDTFNKDQLERITGSGTMVPVQDVPGETAVYLFRDVSTDTSTPTFQRRSAGVAEDMLARHINKVVRPMLGAELVTDQYLDMVSGVLGGVEERHRPHFYSLEFGEVGVITEQDRAKYAFADTGVKVQIKYTHLEEAGSAIIEHVVTG